MENLTIYISSSDAYKDLWPLFFDFFKKYWPECNIPVVLNTEIDEYSTDNLSIISTKVGVNDSFGITFHKGLDYVKMDNILLIMIDYFFMDKVNHELFEKLYRDYNTLNLDSLCLVSQSYENSEKSKIEGINIVIPPSKDMFSFQIAFWRKDLLKQMVLAHENPWHSEKFGSRRANLLKIKLGFTDKYNQPIEYLLEGALHKGKWVKPMVDFLNKIEYKVDFEKRGFFTNYNPSLKNRIEIRIKNINSELKSRTDLLFRHLL